MSKPKRKKGIIWLVILVVVLAAAAAGIFFAVQSGWNWKWWAAQAEAEEAGEECADVCYDGHDYPDAEPDADGYITDPRNEIRYRTVKIGGLAWMAENLNYPMEYSGYCYGGDDANCEKYGRLYYRWYAAMEVCPPGWRLPSVEDWDDLFIAAGGSYDEDNRRWNAAGAKLKAKTGWKNRGGGTDDFGFAALPGGHKDPHIYIDNNFEFAGEGGYWWTSTEQAGSYPTYFAMGWDMNHVNENRLRSDYGLSVRCVRGEAGPPAPGKGRPVPAAPEINTALPVGKPETRWYRRGAKNITISTADQLAGLAELVNGGNGLGGVTVTLGDDIDLSAYGKGSAFNGGKGWIPIGLGYYGEGETRPFRGTFDGNGKKIHGLYINNPELDYAGLFGSIDHDGAIRNLGVADVNITGRNNVGGIVGHTGGSTVISSCHSTGAVKGVNYVGGVVGGAGSYLHSSYSAATVNGDRSVGGVAGYISSEASGCYFTGTVRGTNDVGGVAGLVSSSLTNSYSTGTVSGRAGRVGGVAGTVDMGSLTHSYATGAVSGREGTGGVAGSVIRGGTVTHCIALNPSVKGIDASAGRVAGYNLHGNLSNNAAFTGLKDKDGKADRWSVKGEDAEDGADITAEIIAADPTLGGRLLDCHVADVGGCWSMAEPGYLSVTGSGGNTVEMPEHLR